MRYPRADTAVRPYAEFVTTTNIKSQTTSQTTRCALKQHPSKEVQNALPREGTAALPYAESPKPRNQTNVTRGAGWDVEREGRETKVEPPTGLVPLCTGDFGTSVRHPPRERIAMNEMRHSQADTEVRSYAESPKQRNQLINH